MRRFIGHRLLQAIPVLVLVSLMTLLLVDLVPGEPAYAILGENATPEQVDAINHQLRLDKPFHERYGSWLGDVVTGDFGESFRTRESVSTMIKDRFAVTLELAVLAQLLALVIAIPVGILAAYRPMKLFDRASSAGTSALMSAPSFLSALLLVYLFALKWELVPPTGWVPISENVGEHLKRVALPAITLALGEIAVLVRLLRADMIATLQEEYIAMARAKGLPSWRILLTHALRPSSFSVVTLAGLNLGRLIGGTVIVETVFSLPGLGQLTIQAILGKDYVVVQGIVLVTAVSYVLINLVVDVLYAVLDPRTRLAPT